MPPRYTTVGATVLATLQNGFNLLDINTSNQNSIESVIIAVVTTVRWKWCRRPVVLNPESTTQTPTLITPCA